MFRFKKMFKLFQSFHLCYIERYVLFVNENAIKTKSFGAPPRTQSGVGGACSAIPYRKKLNYFCKILLPFWGASFKISLWAPFFLDPSLYFIIKQKHVAETCTNTNNNETIQQQHAQTITTWNLHTQQQNMHKYVLIDIYRKLYAKLCEYVLHIIELD